MAPQSRELRVAFGRFATGVTVVTCRNQHEMAHGATVNAFTAVSLEPALCQVTLTRKSKACSYLEGAPFAVNVLGVGQVDTAWHFAGRPTEPGPEWAERGSTPYLVGSAAAYFCRPWRTYDGGDHLIVVGEVEHVDVTDDEPLLFYCGAFREIGAVETGTHWGGSLDCPDAGWFDARSSFTPLRPHAA
ncbi:flavin reductase family protein [Pseudonocardia sp. TRM90224]|uniref:flavin reductase family protein n=1 Tax=Pseudonocardia sp. TRM90224 TaxID=2812678 RepID=UPI001E4B636B|nr:flavin reductase family protein [Pseudonocardia sp. TRM90224]